MKKYYILILVVALTGFVIIAQSQAEQNIPATANINAQADILTMVNILTPEKATQDEVIRLLQNEMQNMMRHQPGFISASLHQSLDSKHVVVYAQWQSQEHINQVIKLIEAGKAPEIMKVFSVAKPDFHPYEVVSVHTASASK